LLSRPTALDAVTGELDGVVGSVMDQEGFFALCRVMLESAVDEAESSVLIDYVDDAASSDHP
jgi:hypothetical protein